MLQAIGLTGGGFILIVAFRAIFVMGKEEYFSAQKDYEDGFQKRRSDADECDLEAGNGAEEEVETDDAEDQEERDEKHHNHHDQTTLSYSYIEYNSTSHPQESSPSIPSATPISEMVNVPPPGNNFPPPPPRNTRPKTKSSADVPVAQPITQPSHEYSYTPYTCRPEVKLVQTNVL